MVNDFFAEFEKICNKVKIPKKESRSATIYLKQISEKNKILNWFFSIGPFPAPMHDTTLDCFILTEKFLFNCEFKKDVPLIHMIPLSEIINISEKIHGKQIRVSFLIASIGGITIWDSLENRDELENFVNIIRNKLIDFE